MSTFSTRNQNKQTGCIRLNNDLYFYYQCFICDILFKRIKKGNVEEGRKTDEVYERN